MTSDLDGATWKGRFWVAWQALLEMERRAEDAEREVAVLRPMVTLAAFRRRGRLERMSAIAAGKPPQSGGK